MDGERFNRADKVYPRLRGGSRVMMSAASMMSGLSPPTRGILRLIPADMVGARSIPAYAGDPSRARAVTGRSAVYPRLRGGSLSYKLLDADTEGLSPPTRGIH